MRHQFSLDPGAVAFRRWRRPASLLLPGLPGAFQLVCAAGLGEFYSGRPGHADRFAANASRYCDDELNSHVQPDGEFCRLDILVGGISCPSCVWLLERVIARIAGVNQVSMSYAGGIASVQFNPTCRPFGDFWRHKQSGIFTAPVFAGSFRDRRPP